MNVNILKITQRFPTEDSCIEYFKELKERRGLKCRSCGCTSFYWRPKYKAHDCRNCYYRITLKSGTLLESSKLPFHYWIYAVYYMTNTHNGISAADLQLQLGHKYYEPVWAMMKKIRTAMGHRNNTELLDGIVECDSVKFTTRLRDKDPDRPVYKNTEASFPLVMVFAQVYKGVPGRKRYPNDLCFKKVRMKIDTEDVVVAGQQLSSTLSPDAAITTSGRFAVEMLRLRTATINEALKIKSRKRKCLPWVRIMSNNVKRKIIGTHHHVSDKYLQTYLDEYCYRVNRRKLGFQLFDCFMADAVADTWYQKSKFPDNHKRKGGE